MLGGLLGAQQPFWSYQNSLDLQSELPAATDGMIAARRARGTRTREMRVILKREEGAKERIEHLLGDPSSLSFGFIEHGQLGTENPRSRLAVDRVEAKMQQT